MGPVGRALLFRAGVAPEGLLVTATAEADTAGGGARAHRQPEEECEHELHAQRLRRDVGHEAGAVEGSAPCVGVVMARRARRRFDGEQLRSAGDALQAPERTRWVPNLAGFQTWRRRQVPDGCQTRDCSRSTALKANESRRLLAPQAARVLGREHRATGSRVPRDERVARQGSDRRRTPSRAFRGLFARRGRGRGGLAPMSDSLFRGRILSPPQTKA